MSWELCARDLSGAQAQGRVLLKLMASLPPGLAEKTEVYAMPTGSLKT